MHFLKSALSGPHLFTGKWRLNWGVWGIPSTVHLSVGATEPSTLGRSGALVQLVPSVHGPGEEAGSGVCAPLFPISFQGGLFFSQGPSSHIAQVSEQNQEEPPL